ncbi:MAG: sulfite exporter TauE/SafE family protein [Gemmatimonadales bacterium]|jgi:uncharacterized membrane protein YfcA
MLILGLALALVVGLSLGMLGAGGSILAVPIFVYVLGFDAKEAIAMSLAVVAATSFIGATRHMRAGNINLRVALIFGPAAMAGTYLGARFSVFFSGSAQLAMFAVIVLSAAGFMLYEPKSAPKSKALALRRPALALVLVVSEGLAVGLVTGLVGVSGGFLIVPVLVLLLGIPMKEAVGTALLVISLKSATGFLGYLGHVDVYWGFIAAFTAIAVAGILIGAQLVRYIAPRVLKRFFAVFLLVIGIWILYQNRSVF